MHDRQLPRQPFASNGRHADRRRDTPTGRKRRCRTAGNRGPVRPGLRTRIRGSSDPSGTRFGAARNRSDPRRDVTPFTCRHPSNRLWSLARSKETRAPASSAPPRNEVPGVRDVAFRGRSPRSCRAGEVNQRRMDTVVFSCDEVCQAQSVSSVSIREHTPSPRCGVRDDASRGQLSAMEPSRMSIG